MFLKNPIRTCRLEGSLNKESDGPACIGYSMIHECGGIDNGVISPTDILSFARQVAMAMVSPFTFCIAIFSEVIFRYI